VTESHVYDDHFFDWVDSGARFSARALLPASKKHWTCKALLMLGAAAGLGYRFGLSSASQMLSGLTVTMWIGRSLRSQPMPSR
jgi:hypothetical protein